MSWNQIIVGTTSNLIVAANDQRINLIVRNNGVAICYVGGSSNVTTSTGVQMNQNDTLNDDNSGTRGYIGDIWGIVSSGTTNMAYWERTKNNPNTNWKQGGIPA